MSKRKILLCAAAVAVCATAVLAADHGDYRPITGRWVRLLDRMFHNRGIEMTWSLERDETGEVSGIAPCVAPTPGLNFELGVHALPPNPNSPVPDAIVVLPPSPVLPPNPTLPPNPVRIQVNNPGVVEFFDRDGNPMTLVPAR